MVNAIKPQRLFERAQRVRERAYAPYSKYRVGAAVLGKSGRIYEGCNVENASYGLTICAERSAVVQAIAQGETELTAVAVATSNGGSPCGACRQVLAEFMLPDAPVILGGENGDELVTLTLGELLPMSFTRRQLRRAGKRS